MFHECVGSHKVPSLWVRWSYYLTLAKTLHWSVSNACGHRSPQAVMIVHLRIAGLWSIPWSSQFWAQLCYLSRCSMGFGIWSAASGVAKHIRDPLETIAFLNHYANIGLTVTMSRLVDSWPTCKCCHWLRRTSIYGWGLLQTQHVSLWEKQNNRRTHEWSRADELWYHWRTDGWCGKTHGWLGGMT